LEKVVDKPKSKQTFRDVMAKMNDKEDLMAKSLVYLLEANEATDEMPYTFKDLDLQKIENDALTKQLEAFWKAAECISNFQNYWLASMTKGISAVQNEEENSIDVKVFMKKKIDFKQMTRIMYRLKCANSAVRMLNVLQTRTDEFKFSAETAKSEDCIKGAKIIQRLILLQKEIIDREVKEMETKLQNVNLFYQNLMVTRTAYIAYGSLIVACFAFVISIPQLLQILSVL
jgi:hypothetical protein